MARDRGRRAVIVGGGFAGRRAREVLLRLGRSNSSSSSCPPPDVILIDAPGYIEYNPGILRCLVEPAHASNVLMRHPPSHGVLQAYASTVELRAGAGPECMSAWVYACRIGMYTLARYVPRLRRPHAGRITGAGVLV